MNAVKSRFFDSLPEDRQKAIKEQAKKAMALAAQRKQNQAPYAPPPSRQYTPAQVAAGFANYPKRNTSKLIERLNAGEAKPPKPQDAIMDALRQYGPMTIVEIVEKLGLDSERALQATSQRVYKLVMRSELKRHAKYVDLGGSTVHVYALPGTPADAPYNKPQYLPPTEPKRQPVERKPRQIVKKREHKLSTTERVYKMCLVESLTNAEITERLGLVVNRDTTTRISTLTSVMFNKGELKVVGTRQKRGCPPSKLYASTDKPPAIQFGAPSITTRVADWLQKEGVKTREEIAEFLGDDADYRSAVSNALRYGMVHVAGKTTSKTTGRPINLYAAGPEPKGEESK